MRMTFPRDASQQYSSRKRFAAGTESVEPGLWASGVAHYSRQLVSEDVCHPKAPGDRVEWRI